MDSKNKCWKYVKTQINRLKKKPTLFGCSKEFYFLTRKREPNRKPSTLTRVGRTTGHCAAVLIGRRPDVFARNGTYTTRWSPARYCIRINSGCDLHERTRNDRRRYVYTSSERDEWERVTDDSGREEKRHEKNEMK